MFRKLKNILLVLAVCSTIIENMGGVPLYICIAYFVVSLLDFTGFNNIGYYNNRKTITILWISLFIYLILITSIFSYETYLPSYIFKWIKSLLLFVCVLKDSFNTPKLLTQILVSYILSSFICIVLMSNGIGVELDPSEIGENRLTFLGTNANKMAMVYVYSFSISLFLIDYVSNNIKRRVASFIIIPLILFMALCVFFMANMASRGAFVCIFIELFYYFFFYRKSKSRWKDLLIVALGLCIVIIGYEYISNISIFSKRMELMSEGDFGQRDVLVKAAWNIFTDNPIFGVGLIEVTKIIGSHVGHAKTPHNLYLYVLSAGGVIAFTLLMTILYKAVKIIYKLGYKNKLLLPVLLLICVLIDFAKNGAALTTSVNYVFFAIALNSCDYYNNKYNSSKNSYEYFIFRRKSYIWRW